MHPSSRFKAAALLLIAGFAFTASSYAGMTVYSLRDIYRLRFQEISFFVFLFLMCAVLLKFLLNYAIKGIDFLPRINFRRSLCLSVMFGLGMLLILAMISGIREVLTPGAWRHQGTSYRLNDPSREPVRRRSLEHLRVALMEYAEAHDGKFPPHDFVKEIPEKLWESPDQAGTHYLYSGGLSTNALRSILALEPPEFGETRLALLVTGEIQMLAPAEIEAMLKKK
jgi:hypothetical protein